MVDLQKNISNIPSEWWDSFGFTFSESMFWEREEFIEVTSLMSEEELQSKFAAGKTG